MIQIKYQIELDNDNTIETKSYVKTYDHPQITRDELFRDFEYFISEFIVQDDEMK